MNSMWQILSGALTPGRVTGRWLDEPLRFVISETKVIHDYVRFKEHFLSHGCTLFPTVRTNVLSYLAKE